MSGAVHDAVLHGLEDEEDVTATSSSPQFRRDTSTSDNDEDSWQLPDEAAATSGGVGGGGLPPPAPSAADNPPPPVSSHADTVDGLRSSASQRSSGSSSAASPKPMAVVPRRQPPHRLPEPFSVAAHFADHHRNAAAVAVQSSLVSPNRTVSFSEASPQATPAAWAKAIASTLDEALGSTPRSKSKGAPSTTKEPSSRDPLAARDRSTPNPAALQPPLAFTVSSPFRTSSRERVASSCEGAPKRPNPFQGASSSSKTFSSSPFAARRPPPAGEALSPPPAPGVASSAAQADEGAAAAVSSQGPESTTGKTASVRAPPPPAAAVTPAHLRLYFEGRSRLLARQQWAVGERIKDILRREDIAQCTFSPQISPYSKNMIRPRSLSPENRASTELIRQNTKLAAARQSAIAKELAGCTFRPLTLRAASLSPLVTARGASGETVHDVLHGDAERRREWREEHQQHVKDELESMIERRHRVGGGARDDGPRTSAEIADMVDRLHRGGIGDDDDDVYLSDVDDDGDHDGREGGRMLRDEEDEDEDDEGGSDSADAEAKLNVRVARDRPRHPRSRHRSRSASIADRHIREFEDERNAVLTFQPRMTEMSRRKALDRMIRRAEPLDVVNRLIHRKPKEGHVAQEMAHELEEPAELVSSSSRQIVGAARERHVRRLFSALLASHADQMRRLDEEKRVAAGLPPRPKTTAAGLRTDGTTPSSADASAALPVSSIAEHVYYLLGAAAAVEVSDILLRLPGSQTVLDAGDFVAIILAECGRQGPLRLLNLPVPMGGDRAPQLAGDAPDVVPEQPPTKEDRLLASSQPAHHVTETDLIRLRRERQLELQLMWSREGRAAGSGPFSVGATVGASRRPGQSGTPSLTEGHARAVVERLLNFPSQIAKHRKASREEKAKEEMSECTFWPKTGHLDRRRVFDMQAGASQGHPKTFGSRSSDVHVPLSNDAVAAGVVGRHAASSSRPPRSNAAETPIHPPLVGGNKPLQHAAIPDAEQAANWAFRDRRVVAPPLAPPSQPIPSGLRGGVLAGPITVTPRTPQLTRAHLVDQQTQIAILAAATAKGSEDAGGEGLQRIRDLGKALMMRQIADAAAARQQHPRSRST